MNRIRSSDTPVKTEEQVQQVVRAMQALVQRRKDAKGKLREKIARLRTEAKQADEAAALQLAGQRALVEQWYRGQRELMQFQRVYEVGGAGKFGYRTLTPRVELLPDWTWPQAGEAMEEKLGTEARRFFLSSGGADHRAILAYYSTAPAKGAPAINDPFLASVGLKVTQERPFYVDTFSRKPAPNKKEKK